MHLLILQKLPSPVLTKQLRGHFFSFSFDTENNATEILGFNKGTLSSMKSSGVYSHSTSRRDVSPSLFSSRASPYPISPEAICPVHVPPTVLLDSLINMMSCITDPSSYVFGICYHYDNSVPWSKNPTFSSIFQILHTPLLSRLPTIWTRQC